jgi:arylsulfatase A-like enzyme
MKPFILPVVSLAWIVPVISYADASQESAAPPNIIMLMADDLGYGDVGFNGNEKIITPHLDAMAANGLVLTNFHVTSPLCSPSRASCLTGRDPFRQGIFAAHTGGMRHAETTVAEVVKTEGYRTGFFGKWHLGWVESEKVEYKGHYSPPWQHGYDEAFATKSAVPTWDPTRTPDNWNSWGRGESDAWEGSIYVHNGVPVSDNLDGDDSRIIMDRVIPFIDSAVANNQPFLATVWFHTPHEPVIAGPEYLAMYPDLPEEQRHLYGCITAMDEQIGRLREHLRAKGIADNTVLLFCSDNGAPAPKIRDGIASNGPFRGSKHRIWEGGLRVPAVIEWPARVQAGRVSDYLTSTNDYFPTILEILSIKPDPKVPLDGISILPLLDNKKMGNRPPMAFGFMRLYEGTARFALIDGDFKIGIHDDDDTELFNLKEDPSESHNLAGQDVERLRAMEARLDDIKASWRRSLEGGDYEW